MEENRIPTLFEILNRFSKAPLDLWSFYVFLKEQYGGVEYLEFWLDCADHSRLCSAYATEKLKSKQNNQMAKDTGQHTDQHTDLYAPQPPPPAMGSSVNAASSSLHQESIPRPGALHTGDSHFATSPSSSMLFNMLRDVALDASGERQRSDTRERGNLRGTNLNTESRRSSKSTGDKPNSINSSNEERDLFENRLMQHKHRFSTLSDEQARNKRDTVSRLSEILDNLYMPEYPNETASSSSRRLHDVGERGVNYNGIGEQSHSQDRSAQFAYDGYVDSANPPLHPVPRTQPPNPPNTHSQATHNSQGQLYMDRRHSLQQSSNERTNSSAYSPHSQRTHEGPITKKTIRESAQNIINTFLTPKGDKQIELPCDMHGWSMAADIRQLSSIPGGLDSPKIFDNATAYVFDAMEREALPSFIIHRGLSNILPLSSTLRLIAGLIALFGGFWLSFVFILLNWSPKAHRCWVILPFSFGWYLTITALYHIDPILAFLGLCERDGGEVMKIEVKFVRHMVVKRSVFAMTAIVLCTAAFCVLFILVPGHRL